MTASPRPTPTSPAWGCLKRATLPPVLDWETSDGNDVAGTLAAARAFVAEVRTRTGLTTIIYTFRDYWDSLGDPADFAMNPLWFASDEPSCPDVPAPWSTWLFWQSSAEGTVAGVHGAVDLDRFAGPRGDLLSLAGVDGGSALASGCRVARRRRRRCRRAPRTGGAVPESATGWNRWRRCERRRSRIVAAARMRSGSRRLNDRVALDRGGVLGGGCPAPATSGATSRVVVGHCARGPITPRRAARALARHFQAMATHGLDRAR